MCFERAPPKHFPRLPTRCPEKLQEAPQDWPRGPERAPRRPRKAGQQVFFERAPNENRGARTTHFRPRTEGPERLTPDREPMGPNDSSPPTET
eukprot:7440837-Pyramimonas_sp.AAC.1